MAPLPDLRTLIGVVTADAPTDDPLDLLAQAARSAGEIEQLTDDLLDHFVTASRARGYSWSEISAVLGVSKQAAHKRFAGLTPTFERFTPRAKAVLKDAVDRSRALGATSVGTEHLLLALFGPPEAVAAQVLAESGLTPAAVETLLADIPTGPDPSGGTGTGSSSSNGEIGYSAAARAVLRQAVEEALALGHNYIGTEHLLLGLFHDQNSPGARILASLGAGYEDMARRLAEKFAALRQAK
jgi:ATP-dependent Clp protease ATP-binding subunit ClpA